MSKYKVVEKFISINGEAQYAGELACFVRFAGCNLNCSYCDTKWANCSDVAYEIMSEQEICDYVKSLGVKNVTLTGGEPLIQDDIDTLIEELLKLEGIRVEIETNGSVDISKFYSICGNLSFTLDYKLPGSGMEKFMLTDNYKFILKKDTVKFVVSNINDLMIAKDIIDRFDLTNKTKVYLSSSFNDIKHEEIVDFMIENRMVDVRLQLQMHKYIWDPNKKGV